MANAGERIMRVTCTEDSVFVELADGRTVSAPAAWYPRLLHAPPQQRTNCLIAGAGYGLHWPEIHGPPLISFSVERTSHAPDAVIDRPWRARPYSGRLQLVGAWTRVP